MSVKPAENVGKTLFALISIYIVGGAIPAFFWLYAVWFFIVHDRFIEAALAFVLAPLGAIYGFLRFFGFL